MSAADWRTLADISLTLATLVSMGVALYLSRESGLARVSYSRDVAALQAELAAVRVRLATAASELQKWRLSVPPEQRLTRVWRGPDHRG